MAVGKVGDADYSRNVLEASFQHVRTSTFLRARDITEVGRIAAFELDEAVVSDGCTPARMTAYDPEVELLPCESEKDVELDMN